MIETERLNLRKIQQQDYNALAKFLQDDEVMTAWDGGYSDEEVQEFIDRNVSRYKEDGCGFFLAIEKESGDVVGSLGLIYNDDINGQPDYELAYILDKDHWGKGYAQEAGHGCMQMAYDQFQADRVVAQMRTNNTASEKVAQQLGMKYEGEYMRDYRGNMEPHKIYAKEKNSK